MRLVSDARTDIKKDKVFRLLGRKKDSRLSGRIGGRVEKFIRQAKKIARPEIVYTTKKIKNVEKGGVVLEDDVTLRSTRLSSSLKNADRVAVFLATIGGKMDRVVNSLMEEKNIADACMYDAIGSVAVEGAVEDFQRSLDSAAQKRGEATTMRFSPGYCDWLLQEQRKLFDILDNGLVGVELNPNYLMRPRKSVSGVFGIGGREKIGREDTNPCKLCGMTSCIARRV